VTATLPALSQSQHCRYGCPICPTLRFAEGPVRLTIHKAVRFTRSEYQSGVALAILFWDESVVYGPLQHNRANLGSPDITPPTIAEFCWMGFAIAREVAL